MRKLLFLKTTLGVVMVVWLALESSYVYESYKIRQRVMNGLKLAKQAAIVIEGNAIEGSALDSGWVVHPSNDGVVVYISQNTGVVTVDFSTNVDGGGRTLTLVPLHSNAESGYAFSGSADSSSFLFPVSKVIWVCASANTMTKNATVLKNKGTLQTKYTPLECRF
jgi:hypothetical protein